MTASLLKNLQLFTNLCGQKAMANVVIATTMWGYVNPEEGAAREEELKEDYWKDLMDVGCRTVRFKRTHESAWDIIGSMLKNSSTTLLVQEEMAGPQKSFRKTTVGMNAKQVKPTPSKGLLNRLRRIFGR
jgi:hypothetical protein